MAVAPKPKYKGDRPPALGRLNKYLATDERGKREETLFLDASGNPISFEDATRDAGGYHAKYWHGFIAPSTYECEDLTKRCGGDMHKAAIDHGKLLASRIQRELNSEKAPNIAIHFEKDKDGKDRWHYHFVGEGKANGKIYGKEGILQKSWDREVYPDRKKIVDWDAHKAYKETREELKKVQEGMRHLFKERSDALKTEPDMNKKKEIRKSYDLKEITLINRRHELEIKAVGHRYTSRGDANSAAHKAEIKKIDSRKSLLLKRMTLRNIDYRSIRASRKSIGWGISAGKRGAKKCVSLVADAARKITQKVLESAKQKTEDRTVQKAESALQHPKSFVRTTTFRLASRAVVTASNMGFQSSKAAALASYRASLATGKASLSFGLGVVFAPVTKGRSLKSGSKDALYDLKSGAKDACKETKKGIAATSKDAAKGGKSASTDLASSIGSAGMNLLPKQASHLIRANLEAGKTVALTAAQIVKLSPIQAAKILLFGSLEAAKEASGVVLQTAKLPVAVALPVKAAEMLPIVGLVAKVGRIAAEIGHAAITTTKEFER